FTDRLITVPITTPTVNVARIREKNSSLRLLMVSIILSKRFFIFSIPQPTELSLINPARVIPNKEKSRQRSISSIIYRLSKVVDPCGSDETAPNLPFWHIASEQCAEAAEGPRSVIVPVAIIHHRTERAS